MLTIISEKASFEFGGINPIIPKSIKHKTLFSKAIKFPGCGSA